MIKSEKVFYVTEFEDGHAHSSTPYGMEANEAFEDAMAYLTDLMLELEGLDIPYSYSQEVVPSGEFHLTLTTKDPVVYEVVGLFMDQSIN